MLLHKCMASALFVKHICMTLQVQPWHHAHQEFGEELQLLLGLCSPGLILCQPPAVHLTPGYAGLRLLRACNPMPILELPVSCGMILLGFFHTFSYTASTAARVLLFAIACVLVIVGSSHCNSSIEGSPAPTLSPSLRHQIAHSTDSPEDSPPMLGDCCRRNVTQTRPGLQPLSCGEAR
jgi:hypothetical protein